MLPRRAVVCMLVRFVPARYIERDEAKGTKVLSSTLLYTMRDHI